MMCLKCMKSSGWLILLVGIAYLVADWTTWNFWGISWWTAVFILLGLKYVGMSSCKECKTLNYGTAAKKKK